MKAVTLGNSGVLIREIDPPKPQPHQIMVKVKACGINRSDLLETQGQNFGHTGGDTKILGGEFAGEVVELGTEVEDLSIGDPVMCRGGSGWAEYALAHWRRAIPIDITNFPWEQAATIQGNMQTMHDAMVTNGRFSSGQTILIQGASSAVGLMGLLIARAMEAKLVVGTSTNSERRERLGGFGADLVLDSSSEDWVDSVLQATDGSGVDVTIDMLSGDFMNKNMEATVIHGYIINVGRLAGMKGQLDFDMHARKRQHYIGTTGRTRTIDESAEVARLANEDLWGFVRDEKIRHHIDKVYPLEDVSSALAEMNANRHFGKLVLLTEDG